MSAARVYIVASLTISSLDQLSGSSPIAIICFVSQEEQKLHGDSVEELCKISLPLFSSCSAWCLHILTDFTLEGGIDGGGRDVGVPRGT